MTRTPAEPVRRASCSCGQVAVECVGDPVRVSVCHCTECQRRTGSPFGAQARFARAQVRLFGTPARFERRGDSGGRAVFAFCSTCGSTVWWELDGLPDVVAVAVGAFADQTFPAPTVSVYEDRRHDWVGLPEDLQRIA